jgi:hypothetical protein
MMTLNCKKVKRGIKWLESLIQFDVNGKKNPRSLSSGKRAEKEDGGRGLNKVRDFAFFLCILPLHSSSALFLRALPPHSSSAFFLRALPSLFPQQYVNIFNIILYQSIFLVSSYA